MSSSSHRLLTSATVLSIILVGGCAIPHSAKVPTGGWAAVQAGAGVVVEREPCGGCTSDQPSDVEPVGVAQLSAGYGWTESTRPVLVYLTVPVVTPNTEEGATEDDHEFSTPA